MKSKKKKDRFFAVVSQKEEEMQSEFEDDLYMVEYVTKKGFGYRVWFDADGIFVEASDDLGKKGERQLVFRPNPSSFSPSVVISAEIIK